MKKLLLGIIFCQIVNAGFGQGQPVKTQDLPISGKVTDSETGEALIGASVIEQGTSNGTITDIDGNYQFTVSNPEAIVVFSYVGYEPAEFPVNGRTKIDVELLLNLKALEEVIVVGYGTQREKDLTSSITTIRTEDIVKTPTSQAMQSLQGRVAGVQIVSNGAPGASPTVRVRGVGSIVGSTSPLYVVDGMFFDNIDFLSTNDIETISVLKDASAAAIYGVRAANGVVLIQTKSGNYGQKAQISYEGYYGVQVAQNVLEMADTEQFMKYALSTGSSADSDFIDNAFQRYGRSKENPDLIDVNTDWYDEVLEPYSPIQSHSLSISGGSDKSRYSVGASYFNQEGLLKETRNEYERINFRTKVDLDVTEWLSVGGNVNISNATQYNAEGSVWFNTYFAVPIIPVYDDLDDDAYPVKLANAKNIGYRGVQNPYFDLLYNDNTNNIAKLLGSFFMDFTLIPNKLSFKTTYNYSFGSITERNLDFEYHDGVTDHLSGLKKSSIVSYNRIWDNVLTYNEQLGNHRFTVMGGYVTRSELNDGFFAKGTNLYPAPSFGSEEYWYLYYASGQIDTDNTNDRDSGEPYKYAKAEYGISYLGRVAYNFKDRYLAYATIRRDGTNKFQQKWGNFPTIGAGWVVSEEGFLDVEFINFLKLRGSWGRLGNDGVESAEGKPTLLPVSTAIDDELITGVTVQTTYDLLDQWETVTESNIGITGEFFKSRLSVEADYYVRDTEGAQVTIILPLIREDVRRNKGEIRNSGLEMALNWSDKINADWSYSVGGNFATLKNEVTNLGGQQYLDLGQAEFRQRSIVGDPIAAFFGYETLGVFQTQEQIDESGLTEGFIGDNNLEPGDFNFKDQNGDGVIDDKDRVVLGSYLPSLTYGFNFGVSYKKFDLSATVQGQTGYSILNRKRGEMIFTNDTNIDADLADNLWTGEGSSNKYPSAAGLRKAHNQKMSDYYVEDGSYFRIQNVRLSYKFIKEGFFESLIYVTAEKPMTVFNYNGFNPEVADGIDRQTYPIPAVYTIGLNVRL